MFYERIKHVETDCFFFVRERVASQEITLMKIDNKRQVADLLTKGFEKDLEGINLSFFLERWA